MDTNTAFNFLSDTELNTFATIATARNFSHGELIFTEGDEANGMYIIEAGKVTISIDNSGSQLLMAELGKGNLFGEMALINDDYRNATARAEGDVVVYHIEKNDFSRLLNDNHPLLERIQTLIQARNDELLLKEQLVAITGIDKDHLHVSIKGDPSIRETALTRERYVGIVDTLLPKLVPSIRKLLFETSVYRVFVGLNNGEVRVCTVCNPFIEEMHTAKKIVSKAYIDRHFPPMDYDTKVKLIHDVTQYIESMKEFTSLPASWIHVLERIQKNWTPVAREKLESVVQGLADLRKVPNFYLRNMSISMAQDALRMQFNCDGTHIISTTEYNHFLEENFELET